MDKAYDALREKNEAYAQYDIDLRVNGIRSNCIFDAEGNNTNGMDFSPLNKARRDVFTPFNIKVDQVDMRFIPIIVKERNGSKEEYFYDYESKSAKLLSSFTKDSLAEKGFKRNENKYIGTLMFDSKESYYVFSTNQYNYGTNKLYAQEGFYYLGTYQHMLFACGLDKNNNEINAGNFEYNAYQEFHQEFSSNPLNPWSSINKDDLFEYHLTEIFKNNIAVKKKAKKSVNFYNDCWDYYTKSFDLYDQPEKSKANKLSTKQRYMPGEDQALAYYFSSQLRFLWAASVSTDAVLAVTELENEIGAEYVNALKTVSFLPGFPSSYAIVKSAQDKKYDDEESAFTSFFSSKKYSFLDTWDEVRPLLLNRLDGKKDLATFYGHGCVISFDPELIKLQPHEHKDVAEKLGFEMWESLYEKEIKPFYQKPGNENDMIKFM
ncbi:MAG: hypothetical protein H0X26_06010 [Alphaproteobacteria bacterium]|nr:hypothetical protein [Alphaproteobacteria bacterium]